MKLVFLEIQAMKRPDQGPTLIRRRSLLGKWAEGKRGREERRSQRQGGRRKIVGRPGSLSSLFASDMIPGMVRNGANSFRVITSNYHTLSISPPRCCLQHQPCSFTLDLEEC